jgi:lysophospholipase L1-like esterase
MRTLCTLALLFCAAARANWVGSWATSQQIPEPHNSLAADDLRDATLRQIVHLSVGGARLRVHVSNAFGTAALHFASVHIARPVTISGAKIEPGSDRALTFDGKPDVTVPPGAGYVSDPIEYPAAPLSDLAISIYFDSAPAQQTGHPGSRATSYLVHGDHAADADLAEPKRFDHWYQLSGIDVEAPGSGASVAVLGDSITDGHGATTNGNDRWTDVLARRLQNDPKYRSIGVLNQGIGGNHLLTDGLGPNALARFDRDVLAQAGVRYLIVFEGVNDLGGLARTGEVSAAEHAALVERVLGAYEQIVTRAHAQGIAVFGATITPYTGSDYYHPGPASEADRQSVNGWIRTPGHFDAVIDFDQVTRDPAHPERLLPAFDCGDHLHPSPAGYAAMGEAVPLTLFGGGGPKVAFTFDDLPTHSVLPPGETRIEVANKIIAAMRAAKLPPVYGFVNAVRMEEQPGDEAVLKAWREAGNPLGNHGWSHMNLNQHTVEEFEADVTRDEPALKRWMDSGDWHWLRYPYLAEGNTPEKRAAIRAFLLKNGYKIAGVTMSFADYEWNEPYARCKAKGDQAAIAGLAESYLAAADDSISRYRDLSHAIYGRDIPYVLLMHIGAFDAEMLPKLLKLYQDRGFQFVTLPEAEGDAFYREDTNLSLPPGPDSLEGVAAERSVKMLPRPHFSPAADLCR